MTQKSFKFTPAFFAICLLAACGGGGGGSDPGSSGLSSSSGASSASSSSSISGSGSSGINPGVISNGHPRSFYGLERQAMIQRMVQENHLWWQHIQMQANRTATANEDYEERGLWTAFAYVATGDRVYVDKAWDVIGRKLINYPYVFTETSVPTDINIIREYFVDYLIIYDWLYNGLSQTQRDEFLSVLNQWADRILNRPPFDAMERTIRLTDSDQVLGFYIGLMGMDLVTTPENAHPLAGNFLQATFIEASSNSLMSVGGLDATNIDRTSLRNTLRQYATIAEGGEWFESGMYNMNSVATLSLGVEMARSVTGEDHFPEYTALYEQFAMTRLFEMVPEMQQRYQWGDEQNPRYLLAGGHSANVGIVATLARLTSSAISALTLGFHEDLLDAGDGNGTHAQDPYGRMFYCYDPYATKDMNWRANAPRYHFASGQGLMYFHDGWEAGTGIGTGSSFFGAHFPPGSRADHQQQYWGNFQLWRKGEWAITHPIGYGNSTIGASTNTMLLYGLPQMREFHDVYASKSGEDDSYAYIAGTNSGRYYYVEDRDTPAYVDELTRSLVYLPTTTNTSDTVVVIDRVAFNGANTPPDTNGYWANSGWPAGGDRDRMLAAEHPMQWRLHVPEVPTEIDAQTLEWMTVGGNGGNAQRLRLTHLLPAPSIWSVNDETVLWAVSAPGDVHASERKYHVLLSPTDDNLRWQVFVNVVQAFEGDGSDLSVNLVTAGPACGVQLGRPAHDDRLLLFGCEQASRLHTSGYTVDFSVGANSAEILFFDLATSRDWTVSIDGAASTALDVSDAGVAHLTVAGTGAHQVIIN